MAKHNSLLTEVISSICFSFYPSRGRIIVFFTLLNCLISSINVKVQRSLEKDCLHLENDNLQLISKKVQIFLLCKVYKREINNLLLATIKLPNDKNKPILSYQVLYTLHWFIQFPRLTLTLITSLLKGFTFKCEKKTKFKNI